MRSHLHVLVACHHWGSSPHTIQCRANDLNRRTPPRWSPAGCYIRSKSRNCQVWICDIVWHTSRATFVVCSSFSESCHEQLRKSGISKSGQMIDKWRMHVEVRTDWQPSDTHRKAAAKVWKPRTVRSVKRVWRPRYFILFPLVFSLEELGSSWFLFSTSSVTWKVWYKMSELQSEALGLPTLFKGVLEMPRTQSKLKLRHLPDRTCCIGTSWKSVQTMKILAR